jgi:anti-anti-sigma factor
METRTEGDITVVVMVPRFDAYTASEVEAAFRDLITKGAKKIVCDFSQTVYVASAGLRVLLANAKTLQKSGGQIVLASLKPYVQEVFDISGFSQLFKVFSTQNEALEKLKAH